MSWASRHIGTPFDKRGRGDGEPNGVFSPPAHCWGIVRRVFRVHRGIELPSYGPLSAEDMVAVAREVKRGTAAGGPWSAVPLGAEEEFDVALMLGWVTVDGVAQRRPAHFGVFTPDRKVLHVEEGTDAICVPLDHTTIGSRYIGAWRYRTSQTRANALMAGAA